MQQIEQMNLNKFILYIINSTVACLVISSCNDRNFLDRTKIDGSILMGQTVQSNDPVAEKTVLLAHNFEYNGEKIQYFGLCTAVVLNKYTVLTAAHCVENYSNSKIILARNIHSMLILKNQVYEIKKVIIHDQYLKSKVLSSKDLSYDLAIVQLVRPMEHFNFEINNSDLVPTADFVQTNNSIDFNPLIAGFGRNQIQISENETKPINGILEKSFVTVDNDQYSERLISIDQNQKSGACFGDSGGPLFINREGALYLQGLAVAFKSNEICRGQAIYLNLDFFKDWIKEKLLE